jgi:hypothetical protein
MNALRLLAIPILALAACATSKESAPPAPAASTEPVQVPASAPKGPAQNEAKRPPAATASGPTTASEAAERVHEEWVRTHGGSGGDEPPAGADDGPCSRDDQCALTKVAPSGCCETLCIPRAVTRARAEALAANQSACTHGKICPDVSCRPPLSASMPKCQAGRCVAEHSKVDDR